MSLSFNVLAQHARTAAYRWRRDQRPIRYVQAVVAAVAFALFGIRRRVSRTTGPERLLVISPAGIGDMFMLTPALRALGERYPRATLDLLALHDYVGDAFSRHPRIRRIHYIRPFNAGRPESRFARIGSRRNALLKTLWYYPDLVMALAGARYDLGVNFSLSTEYDLLGNALLRAANIPVRLGMRDHGLGLLTSAAEPDVARVHRVDAYLAAVAPILEEKPDTTYEFPVAESDLEAVRESLDTSPIGKRSGPLVALHPGGKILVNSRRWPPESFVSLGRTLQERDGARIVVLGDESEVDLCAGVAREIGEGAMNAAGGFTIPQVVALLSECDLCVTNDTATLHLAEAAGTPRVISIFGPTDHRLIAPRNPRHRIAFSNLPCAPCLGSIITSDSPRCWREIKEECLVRITPDEVLELVHVRSGAA